MNNLVNVEPIHNSKLDRLYQCFEHTFHIHPNEFRLVHLFLIYGILIMSSYTILSTSALTLFLSRVNSATLRWLLPYNTICIAISAALVTWFYQKFIDSTSRIVLITWVTVLFGSSFLLTRWLLFCLGGHTWIYFSFVVCEETYLAIIGMIFYSFLGDYFNVQNARQLYGYIGGGLAIGAPLGGFSASIFLHYISVANLLYIATFLLLLGNVIAYTIWKTVAIPHQTRTEIQKANPFLMRKIFSNKYLIVIFIIGIIIPVFLSIEGYQFASIAGQTLNEAALGAFMGKFFGYVGITQILINFILAAWMLRTLGILKTLMILPLLFIACSIGFIIHPIFPIAAAFKFIDVSIGGTLNAIGIQMLFLPLSQRIRVYSQSLFCGIISSGGIVLGSIILIILSFFAIPIRFYSVLILVLCVTFLLAIFYLMPFYRKALAASLNHVEIDPLDMQRVLNSSLCNQMVPDLIRHADTKKIITILQWLPLDRLKKIKPIIQELLDTNNTLLMVEALNILAVFDDEKNSPLIKKHLSDSRPEIQSVALYTFCRLGKEKVFPLVKKYFDSPTAIVCETSLISAYRYCGKQAQSFIIDQVKQRVGTNKVSAMTVIGEIADPAFEHDVEAWLDDPNQEIQKAALILCKHYPSALIIKKVIQCIELKSPLRFIAAQTLSSMPASAIDTVILSLHDSSLSEYTQYVLLLALGKMGGKKSILVILDSLLSTDSLLLLTGIDRALKHMPFEKSWTTAVVDKMNLCQEQLLTHLVTLKNAYLEMGTIPPIIKILYFDAFYFYVQLLFSLLSIRYGIKEFAQATNIFQDDDASFLPSCLELLESVIPKKFFLALKNNLLPPLAQASFILDIPTQQTIQELFAVNSFIQDLTLFTIHTVPAMGQNRKGAASMTEKTNQSLEYIDRIIFLKQTELFKEMPTDPLVSIVDIIEQKAFKAGDCILKEGEKGGQLLIILSGKVRIERNQKEIVLLQPGETLGELTLIDGLPQSASAFAVEDTQLLCLNELELHNLLKAYPQASEGLMKILSDRLRKTTLSLT